MSMLQNKSLKLQALGANDSAWMETIHAQSFDEMQRWRADAFTSLFQQPLNKAFAVCVDEQRAGFIVARNVAGEGEILTLAIHPDYRRNGLATQLVNAFIESEIPHKLESIFLEVMLTNQAAIHLYTALGFTVISTRPGYYKMPEGHPEKTMDGLVMKKNLSPRS